MLDNYDDYKTGGTHKVFCISVVGENITITNENLRTESIVLDEELCSSTNLKFGSCGTSKFTAEIANVFENFEGKLINVTVTMDNEVTKYGTFKVISDKPIADRIYRSLTAYDAMNDIIKTNVLSWYKSLTFPMTLKNFRDSFFNYLGITQETTTLVNDNFIIPGGFTASDSLMGGTIITAICELNGVFGHINRDGKFEYIDLTQSESFECPPYENGSVTYEDYVTSPITKVTMRGTASDVGTSVGVAGNEYIIQGNPLIYGTEGTQALTTAITNLLNKIKTIVFRPFDLRKTIGNPCVEIGDAITIDTKYETVTSYVLRRTLTGIQALRDRYSASGSRVYPAVATSYSNEITRTQGKIHEVEVSLDEFRSEVSQTYVTQTAYNSKIQELQDEIDGAIESFTGSAVPTLNNYPASDWTTTTEKDKHIGDLYLVNSQGGDYAGFYYRFEKNNSTYSWVHIPDNEVQKALSDAAEANRKAEAAQNTADGIATDLSTNYSTTQQMNSAINQKAEEIELAVSQTYATQQTVTNVKNSTIKSDVLHYLATSAGSGVTRSTPGWTTTVQSMTETNQYLWTYHTYTYGDDHTSDTDPIITGRYGQNGSQGPQGPTGPQGPQGSQGNPGDDGISIVEVIPLKYAGNSTTAPTAPTSNVTRTDAATGVWTRGVPALTNTYKYMYTCDQIKYSNNTYTWTSVVLDNAITNLTQRMTQAELDLQPDSITAKVASTDTFTTIEQFNNLEIGGRNLITNTSFDTTRILPDALNPTSKGFSYYGQWAAQIIATSWLRANIKPLTNYIISFDYEVIAIESGITDARSQGIMYGTNMGTSWLIDNPVANRVVGFKKHCEQAWTTGDDVSLAIIYWYGFYSDSNHRATNDTIRITNLKLEEGNRATAWSPAPEDTETNAVNTAKSYTDAQLQITSSSILSTVEQGYTTKRDFNNLSIGGENVLERSKNFELVNTYILTQQGAITTNAEGFTEAEQRGNGTIWIENYMRLYLDATDKGLVGKDITISIDFKTNDISKIGNMFCSWGSQDASGTRVGDVNIAINSYKTVDGSALANNKWTRIYYTFRVETIANNSRYYIIQFKINSSIPSGTSMYYRKPKVEIGNRPTDWSPALYDIQPVGTNLMRYAPETSAPTAYMAYKIPLTEKLTVSQTYTIQMWDVNIAHSGKAAADLGVFVYAGGGSNQLISLKGFTNGHANYLVGTFTVNSSTDLANQWLQIYNSTPNASGTLNLTIGRWKLEKGNKATEWQMNPIDASSKSEVQQLSNMVAVKVNSSGRLVTAALGVDPSSATSYVKVKADDIDIISNGNIQLTGKSIGITSTNFSVTASGSITAKAGTIGGWSIESTRLHKTVSTGSDGRYASELKPDQLKIAYASGSSAITSETYIKSGIILAYGQGGSYSSNTAVIIDGDGQSLGYDFSMIKSFGAMLTYIVPSTGSEVSVNGALFNTNGNCYVAGSLQLGEAASALNCGIDIFGGGSPYIDFHLNHSSADFTARIVHRAVSNTNYIDFIASSSTWIDCRAKSFANQSSKHVKKNIKNITEAEAKKLLELRPVKFDYKFGGAENQRGLIAEEVNEIMPEMVIGADAEFNKNEPWNTPSIDYSKFVPYLIKMIQIQQKEIDDLKK